MRKSSQTHQTTFGSRTAEHATRGFTAEPVCVPCTPNAERACAEFFRLPKSGTLDPIFSLSRSKWNQLILPCEANGFKPPVQSICVRKLGAIRGCRLIVADSAHAYFASLVAEADKEGELG